MDANNNGLAYGEKLSKDMMKAFHLEIKNEK